jgi:hypothetical protein
MMSRCAPPLRRSATRRRHLGSRRRRALPSRNRRRPRQPCGRRFLSQRPRPDPPPSLKPPPKPAPAQSPARKAGHARYRCPGQTQARSRSAPRHQRMGQRFFRGQSAGKARRWRACLCPRPGTAERARCGNPTPDQTLLESAHRCGRRPAAHHRLGQAGAGRFADRRSADRRHHRPDGQQSRAGASASGASAEGRAPRRPFPTAAGFV